MYITRKHPKGGRALKSDHYPLAQDKNSGEFGLLVGYFPNGCQPGDKVLLRLSDAESVANSFADTVHSYQKAMKTLKPHIAWQERFVLWITGKLLGDRYSREVKDSMFDNK